MKTIEPELQSIEAFAEYLLEDERDSFMLADCQALGAKLHISNSKIRDALEGYGFRYIGPEHGKTMRGFTTGSNDRWYGPGSSRTHGGGGGSSIVSLANTKLSD